MSPKPLRVPLDALVDRLFPDGAPARLDATAMDGLLARAYANAHALIRHEYDLVLDPNSYDRLIYDNAQKIARTAETLARSAVILHRLEEASKSPAPAPARVTAAGDAGAGGQH